MSPAEEKLEKAHALIESLLVLANKGPKPPSGSGWQAGHGQLAMEVRVLIQTAYPRTVRYEPRVPRATSSYRSQNDGRDYCLTCSYSDGHVWKLCGLTGCVEVAI